MTTKSSFLFLTLVTMVSCHVTIFRDGMWQVVPGRRPDNEFSRFGFQSLPFGERNNFENTRFGFPGQFQPTWQNNMWMNSRVARPALTDPNNPDQWISNTNINQQIAGADPWAQYRLLTNSVNPVNQGSVVNSNLNPSGNNAATQANVANSQWNTWAVQTGRPLPGPNAGTQFPIIPNNNGIVDPFGQFQRGSNNMFGSQSNGQFQRIPNNGMQFVSNDNSFGKK